MTPGVNLQGAAGRLWTWSRYSCKGTTHLMMSFHFPETSGFTVCLEVDKLWCLNFRNLTNRYPPPTSTHTHTPLSLCGFLPCWLGGQREHLGAPSLQLVCLLMRPNQAFYHCHPFLLTSIPPPLSLSPLSSPAISPEATSLYTLHLLLLPPHRV